MILERIESDKTRKDKTGQDKTREEQQCEIIDEQKSKEIITHTNVHKNIKMINDSNNNRNDKRNSRITMPHL